MNRKAVIFGIKSIKLTSEERILLKETKPWGIILFSRNIENFEQLRKLIREIKITMQDTKYPILIDQEGGRISRLNKIIDFSLFSQAFFGNLYIKNRKKFYYYYKIYIEKVSSIFKDVGININTAPVLDVLGNQNNTLIGDRSFSKNPKSVSDLGSLCIKLFNKNKIGTVMKHIPGHGSTIQDSHFTLPVVNKNKKELERKDFLPFRICKPFFAMTAHVLYKVYDPNFVATHSKIIIEKVIRKHMNFKGLLISDDISMKALRFNIKENTTLALEAGCNLILHCNGNIKEMKKIANIVPNIDNFTLKKTSQFYNFLR